VADDVHLFSTWCWSSVGMKVIVLRVRFQLQYLSVVSPDCWAQDERLLTSWPETSADWRVHC